MTRQWFHHPLSHQGKTWLARLAFIGGVSALAFAATSHTSPGEASAQTRSGESRVEEEDYLLTLSTSGTYTEGKEGVAVLKLTPKSPFKIDKEFAIKFHLADPPGEKVTFTKKKLEKADGTVSEGSAVFNVPFTVNKTGRATVSGKLHFKVCAEKCNNHNIDIHLQVEAVAPAPAPSPSPNPSPAPTPPPKP